MKSGMITILIVGALFFGALNFHVILFDDSLKILKKTELKLEHTFVDARGSKLFNILLMPDLLQAGIRDLLNDANKKLDESMPNENI